MTCVEKFGRLYKHFSTLTILNLIVTADRYSLQSPINYDIVFPIQREPTTFSHAN